MRTTKQIAGFDLLASIDTTILRPVIGFVDTVYDTSTGAILTVTIDYDYTVDDRVLVPYSGLDAQAYFSVSNLKGFPDPNPTGRASASLSSLGFPLIP